MRAAENITAAALRRGAAALLPFVERWQLPVPAGGTGELAYAVLAHAPGELPQTEAEWEVIADAVSAQLDGAEQWQALLGTMNTGPNSHRVEPQEPGVAQLDGPMTPIPVTDVSVQRAGGALVGFVERWQLPLNPEDLDDMVFAVLTHAPGPLPQTDREWAAITDAVRVQLDERDAKLAAMNAAWAADIKRRYSTV